MTTSRHTEEVQKLFLKNSGLLMGFILGLTGDMLQAEDILQETFVEVARKAGDFTLGSDFLAWARAIARFKVLEHRRVQQQSPHLLADETIELLAASAPAADDKWAARRRALALCLEEIAPKARKILELRYTAAALPAEIARKLSWTVNAVNVALAKTRKFLRECAERRLSMEEASHE